MELDIGGEHLVPKFTVYNEISLPPHETDQSKSCLCTESPLDVEEIKKKLIDYNRELQKQDRKFLYIITRVTRRLTKELEELIRCLLTPELLPYLQSFFKNDAHSYIQLIFHHVLAKLDHPARQYFNSPDTKYCHLKCYFDLYYEDTNPEVSFDLIHEVWKCHPCIELPLRLLCCKRLLENKHYDILNRLIQNNEEYFLLVHKNLGPDMRSLHLILISDNGIFLTVLLTLLFKYVTSRQTAKIKAVLMLVENTSSYLKINRWCRHKGCEYFMLLTFSLKQTRFIPLIIKVLLNRPKLYYICPIITSLCNERLLMVHHHEESMDFIKNNSHYILNVPFILKETKCYVRYSQCKLLLTLLHMYIMSEDLTNMNHVLNRLQEFRHSLLLSTNKSCACFMGKGNCWLFNTYGLAVITVESLHIKNTRIFQSSLLSLTINYLRNKVINEEIRPVWYLKHMIDAVEKYLGFREYLIEEFISFIEQISIENETGIYDVIKTLCDLEMKPEIQDMFIQVLTYHIHVKYNKQNSYCSNLLLDINMTCYKGEFLTKLTINMGQHLLSFAVDTSNDVEEIIYRCFCELRHENKDIDIAKYQEHFTFISTMDAQEKMLKMSNLRSYILMLILLMISSDSQHNSAKLKKYLSLKYAYEDAILYLLWCSGDVEINPGPTLKTLRPQADSVKKRNWIHDMCTIALKLVKNKSFDSKSDGLWKEKPDSWKELHANKPFYDPRNKPKSKKFTIKTDEELLSCLLNCCDGKNITLPPNFQREITAWKNDKPLLLVLCVTRLQIKDMRMAKDLLNTYRENPAFKQHLNDCNFDLSFDPDSRQEVSPKGYSDVVRDLAITFCRISKGLHIFEKSDGIWKTPPFDWNPNDLYYSPCNTGKRHEKHQDQTLVDNLLFYCESKSIPIPSELQLVANAWKQRDSQEICKHYTIWSSMAIIQHSLKYLEIEGVLEKPHVQQSLKQIGVSLHCEKSPNQLNNDSTVTTDNERKVSGLPTNSLSNNQKGTNSSSSVSSASDSDIVCSQHPYEAKALTNSHLTKSVIKCSKPDFQNNPSTSCCTIYSTLLPCPDSRGDLQYTDESLDIPNSYKSVCEISCQEPDFQPSTSSCTIDSKRAPCQENSVDLQPRDDRDRSDSHKSLPEISREEPDLQPSTSGCSAFNKRPECRNVRDKVPSTARIQKRCRPSSEERSDKRPRLHSGNESQASITRCNGDTTPSSHCDSDIADQCVNSTGYMEDSSDQSSNRITPPDNIQDTDSSKDQLFGPEDEIPQHLDEIADRYIIVSFDNQEENWEENLEENLGEDLENIDKLLKLWET